MAVNMKEQRNGSELCWMDTHFSPDDSKLLEGNHKEMDKSIQQILRLIGEEDECLQNKSELALHFRSFCHNYQLLAEHYEKLMGKLQGSGSLMSIPFDSESGPNQGTPQVMPNPKSGLHKSGNQITSPCSGAGSYDLSTKEGNDSSSLSSDSDSEISSFSSNIYVKSPTGTDNVEAHKNKISLEVDLPSMKDERELAQERETDFALKIEGKTDYKALEQRLLKCEEELKLCNRKLQLSEEEVARLTNELENRDFLLEKEQVSEIQTWILQLEAQIIDSSFETARLKDELTTSKDRVKDSDEEIARLKYELQQKVFNDYDFQAQLRQAREELDMVRVELNTEKMQVLDLQDRITSYCSDLSDREDEIEKLKNALSAAKEEFSEETSKLKSDNVGLSSKQIELEAGLKEWELRGKLLEDQLRHCEDEKTEMRDARKALETGMQVQINQLKKEVAERGHQIEALNKDYDKHKLKYDMLMAEKDEITAKVNHLLAEICSRDIQIGQIEEHLRQSDGKHMHLVFESESSHRLVQDLKSRVTELEKEVEGQKVMMMDRAEEKREAIRQLCFSLEHYRNGYEQLYQAVSKRKQHAVTAS